MVLTFKHIFALVLLSMCTLSGCIHTDNEDVPDFEVYDEEQFADILYDLTLVEAAYRINLATVDAQNKKNLIFKSVLVNHKTDSLTFDMNWNYYSSETEKLIEVYKLVTQKIDEQRALRGAAIKTEEE